MYMKYVSVAILEIPCIWSLLDGFKIMLNGDDDDKEGIPLKYNEQLKIQNLELLLEGFRIQYDLNQKAKSAGVLPLRFYLEKGQAFFQAQ